MDDLFVVPSLPSDRGLLQMQVGADAGLRMQGLEDLAGQDLNML
jgi:hypothetical protein